MVDIRSSLLPPSLVLQYTRRPGSDVLVSLGDSHVPGGLLLPHPPSKVVHIQHSPPVTFMLGPRRSSGRESSPQTMSLLHCFEAN